MGSSLTPRARAETGWAVTFAAAIGTAGLLHGAAHAQPRTPGQALPTPEASYTIAPSSVAPIIVHTGPHAVCTLDRASGARARRPVHVYADDDGVLRLYAQAAPGAAASEAQVRLNVACQTDGGVETHPLAFRLNGAPTAEAPFPAAEVRRQLRGLAVPALTDEEAQKLQDREILRRGYPPRPDKGRAPQAYTAWLKAVATPSTLVEPVIVASPDVRFQSATTSGTWSGFVINQPAGGVASVAGSFTQPAATAGLGQSQQAAQWVGIDGWNGVPDLVQTGTNAVAFNLPPVTFTSYYPWTEYLPTQTTGQVLSNLPVSPGDQMFAYVWVDGAPAAAGDPSAFPYVTSSSSQQHVFFRDQSGGIWQVYWDQGRGLAFEEWNGVGSPTNAPLAVGDPATMVANNQQHVFYRDLYGSIFHLFWDPNSGLHSEYWASGGGNSTTGPAAAGEPATLVTPNQQHIFYRDTAGNIQHVFWDANSGRHAERWAGPSGSPSGGPGALGDPQTLFANNQQHVFYRALQLIGGTDNPIWHVYWDPGSGLHAQIWAGLGSPNNAPAAAGDPATLATANQQHIFYRDSSHNIWHVFWDSSSGMHLEQWASGAGGSSTMGPAAYGDPAAVFANNQQHIFYRDLYGSIFHVFWDPSSGRHVEYWASGPGSGTTGPAAASDPTTMVWNTQQHIFYRDGQGRLQHVYWDPSSGRHAEQWAGPGPNGMGNFGEFMLKDSSAGWSARVSLAIGYSGAKGQEAEWVIERPQVNGSPVGLANYGTAQFTDAVAGSNTYGLGAYACCGSGSQQITMTNAGRALSAASVGGLITADFAWKAPF
jgi:hypothetical protein